MSSLMLPPCSTEHAVLVCAVPDAKGVLRFPSEAGATGLPGLPVDVQALTPINTQLVAAAVRHFGRDVALGMTITQEFADRVDTPGGAATIYIAALAPSAGVEAAEGWQTMPDILRSLTGRSRIPYLRAWQVLAGGLHLDTKAALVSDAEVAKHFDD